MKYLFAWSDYSQLNGKKARYTAVKNDLSLYTSNDWDTFYKETKTYCDKDISYFCNGYLTSNENEQIYTHPHYLHPFIINDEGCIVPLTEDDITYYQRDNDNEAAYFRNHTFNGANLD